MNALIYGRVATKEQLEKDKTIPTFDYRLFDSDTDRMFATINAIPSEAKNKAAKLTREINGALRKAGFEPHKKIIVSRCYYPGYPEQRFEIEIL